VEIENDKAEIEEGKCSVIKKDVEEKKTITETKL
jgi:dynein heavy chain, axonemal